MEEEHAQERPKAPSLFVTKPGQLTGQDGINEISSASPMETKSPAEPFPTLTSEPSPIRSSSFSSFDSALDEGQLKMKTAWERSIHRYLNARSDYDRVSVLLIKWSEELDELHTDTEVAELKEVFESFKFEAEILELGNEDPNLQLMSEVTNFARKHQSLTTRNLLIVYYTGHGYWNCQTSVLHLAPARHESSKDVYREEWPAKAAWNSAERALIDVKADVLTIMDTCFASNLMEVEVKPNITWDDFVDHKGIFELLCASGRGKGTPRPGKSSFTHDLIRTLRELLKQPDPVFSTFDLTGRLTLARNPKYTPQLWNRLLRDDPHIRLAALTRETTKSADHDQKRDNDISKLTLQFELDKSELSTIEVQRLSEAIGGACNRCQVSVQRVDWRGVRRQRELRERLRSGAGKVALTNSVIRRLSRSSIGSEGVNSNDVNNASPRSIVASPVSLETNALHPLDHHRKRPSPNADLEPRPQRQKAQSR